MRRTTIVLGLLLAGCTSTPTVEPSEPLREPAPEPAPAPRTVVSAPSSERTSDGTKVQRPTPALGPDDDPACMGYAAERKKSVSMTIRRRMPGLEICFEQALRKDPDLKGKFTYKIFIAPAGEISRVDVLEDTLRSGELVRCTVAKIQTWQFGPSCPSDSADVTFSVSFTS